MVHNTPVCLTRARCTLALQVKRTLKFLQAISVVPYILDEDWVRDSLRAGNFVEEDRYMLKYVLAGGRWWCRQWLS